MHYHDRSIHTQKTVQMPRFVDWDTQPSSYKRYPHFYQRFPFDSLPLKDLLPLLGSITQIRNPDDNRYDLRVIPSAGTLFPVELYMQIRGIPGMIEGVYHYEANTNSLVLLHLVERDGIEPWLGLNRFSGIIFLVSVAWFRSAWKYENRSFRYCMLDAGHQTGAIEAACAVNGRPFAVMTGFDKKGLAEQFGMEDKEFLMTAVLSGEEKEKEVRPLSLLLPHVLPTDYHESFPKIPAAYQETYRGEITPGINNPDFYETDGLKDAILRRRSIRAFEGTEMNKGELDQILTVMNAPFSCSSDPSVNIYSIVSGRITGMTPGIYKNDELIREGDFMDRAEQLCVNQKLSSRSGATLFLTGQSDDYQALMMKAGNLGQRLYLEATRLNLGASGMGAFLDKEVQQLLHTDDRILYAMAVGR